MLPACVDVIDLEFPKDRFRPGPGAVAENWFDYRTDVLWIGTEGVPSIRAAAHELAHFVLHAGTPYGLFLDQMAYLQRHVMISYCLKVVQDLKEKIRYPIYHFAKRFKDPDQRAKLNLQDSSRYDPLISDFVRPWSEAAFVEQVMDGRYLPSIVAAREGKAIKSFHAVEQHLRWLLEEEKLFAGEVAPPVAHEVIPAASAVPGLKGLPNLIDLSPAGACPFISILGSDTKSVLGAISIFEGHAFVRQIGYNKEMMQSIIHNDPSLAYSAVYLSVVTKFRASRAKSKEDYTKIKRTLVALCDLALFTPIGPVYSRLRPARSTWADVHPGYRFMSALNKVAENNLWLNSFGQEDYRAFQNNVCQTCGWPVPDQFVAIGICLRPVDSARHRKACQIRRKFPNLFVEEDDRTPGFDQAMQELIIEDFPLLFAPSIKKNSLFEHADPAAATGKIVQYFLETFLWHAMTSRQLNFLKCLPEKLEYHHFSSNIENNEQMLELIAENISFLRENRFQMLD